LKLDLDGNGTNEINADWRVYLATGGVRVDVNNDGDYEDFGDIVIGTATSGDTTDPSMSVPPNITVNANVGASGTVRVYYTNPTATDSGTSLTVVCSPPAGAAFPVGPTTVSCTATDLADNSRTRTFTVTVVANPQATVPTATNGAPVTVEATGFQPNSLVFVRFQSETVYIGVFTADADGKVVLDLTVPDGLPPGSHDIVVEGVGADGGVWQYVQPLTVPGGELPPAAQTPDPAPAVPVVPVVLGPLPATGGDGGAWPLLPLGTFATVFGAALLVINRRRRSV
jgi:hypothetical protein